MKPVDAIRLFLPLVMGAIISLVFAFYLLSKFGGYTNDFNETKSDYEKWENKFSSLSGDKKIKIAEIIFSEDLGCSNTYQKSFKTFYTIISVITYMLAATLMFQGISILSYLNLGRKTNNPINQNGIRIVVFTNISLVFIAVFLVLAKISKPLQFDDQIALILGGLFGMFLTWKIYKKSIYASWCLMLFNIITIFSFIYEQKYGKLFFSAIHLYVALEAILSVRGLQNET